MAFGGIFARVRSWVRDRGGFRIKDRVRGCVRGGLRVKVGLGVKMQLMVHEKKSTTTVTSYPPLPFFLPI